MSSPLFHASFAFASVGLLPLLCGDYAVEVMPAMLLSVGMDLDISILGTRHAHRIEVLVSLCIASIVLPLLLPFLLAVAGHFLLDVLDCEGLLMFDVRLGLPAPRLLRGIEAVSLPWSIVLLLLFP